ncbi:MAG: hypothetical protein RIT40_2184 [Planctomycetota bacterium]|jgi:hypothetical protein
MVLRPVTRAEPPSKPPLGSLETCAMRARPRCRAPRPSYLDERRSFPSPHSQNSLSIVHNRLDQYHSCR